MGDSEAPNTEFGERWTVFFFFRRARPGSAVHFSKTLGRANALRQRRPHFIFCHTCIHASYLAWKTFSYFYVTCTAAIGFSAAVPFSFPLERHCGIFRSFWGTMIAVSEEK